MNLHLRIFTCALCWISLSAGKESVDELQDMVNNLEKNVTELRDSFSGFRQAITNHLHRLHQYQMNNQVVIQKLINKRRPAGMRSSMGGQQTENQTLDGEEFFIPRSFRGPPLVRDPEDYDFGICVMSSNFVLPPEKRERIRGVVKFFQKKGDPTLHVYVRIRGFNVLYWNSVANSSFQGSSRTLHVHENADFSKGCDSLGDFYQLQNITATLAASHVGDFGDLNVDEDGSVHVMFMDSLASLHGENSIIGKSLVIHSPDEDMSLQDDLNSLTPNQADKRLACCVIEKTQYMNRR